MNKIIKKQKQINTDSTSQCFNMPSIPKRQGYSLFLIQIFTIVWKKKVFDKKKNSQLSDKERKKREKDHCHRAPSIMLTDIPSFSPSGGGSCGWKGLWGNIAPGDKHLHFTHSKTILIFLWGKTDWLIVALWPLFPLSFFLSRLLEPNFSLP